MTMTPLTSHLAIPAVAPLLFFTVAATPVDLLGCRTRGLLAFGIALVSVLAGLGAAVMALKGRLRGDPRSPWWVFSSLILALPALGLILLA